MGGANSAEDTGRLTAKEGGQKKTWTYGSKFPDPSTIDILTHTDPAGAKYWHWEDFFWSGKRRLIKKYEDLRPVDQKASRAPSYLKTRPKQLVEYLTRDLKTDLEKHRVLFRWICENIKYDMVENKKAVVSAGSQKMEAVLRTGLAVCTGYSHLYEELCKLAELECTSVTGIARKASRDPEDYFTVDNPRFGPWSHMWNMIKLNNKSYLCDVTWAAGSSDGDTYTKEWSEMWFITDPDQFVFSHLPFDGDNVSLSDQLKRMPFTTVQGFTKVPYQHPKVAAYQIKPLSHKNQIIQTKSSLLKIRFKCTKKNYLDFATKLEKKSGVVNKQYIVTTYPNRCVICQVGDQLHVTINLPGDGTYMFRLMGKPVKGDDTSTNVLISYKIFNRGQKDLPQYFSECNEIFGMYPKFRAAGYKVKMPKKGAVITSKNGRAKVKLHLPSRGEIPNSHKLFVEEDNRYRELKDCVYGEREGKNVKYRIRCPVVGTYYFQLLYKPEQGRGVNEGYYHGGCYQIRCKKACKDEERFTDNTSWGGPTRQFYNLGLTTSAKGSTLPVVSGRVQLVVLKTRSNVNVWAQLHNKLHVADSCLTKTTDKEFTTFTLQPPVRGYYFIKLYASNTNSGPEVALYCVKYKV